MRILLGLLAAMVMAMPVWAAAKKTPPAPASVTMVMGQATATYYAFGRDMKAYMQNKQLTLDVRESEGSVDNIKRINNPSKLTVGLVQSDVLGFLSRSHNNQSKQIVSHLRVLFPLYHEEVHVLARREIEDFRELQGKKVAVGEEGSGHMLTAVNLFAMEQIVPSDIKKISPEEGVVEVLKGDLDAVIFVGGKPVKIFKNMEDLTKPEYQKFSLLLQNVHFLPLNNAKFYQEYEPAEITPRDYSFVKSTVPTISVQAVLVSYDAESSKSKAEKRRCDQLRIFAKALRGALPELRASGHPKWQEVDLSGDVIGWKKDACVRG